MGWRECNKMDEKLKFIARYLEGEKIAPLCREFGISRPTAYKLIRRYKKMGELALVEQKRTPYRYANKLPIEIEALILNLKREYPNWGAPKVREKIIKKYPDIKPPAKSTIHAIFDRHGLIKHRKGRKRYKANGTPLNHVRKPNQLWCADYKGEFMLGNKQYCYPLTITDYASRYLITCESLSSTREDFAIETFIRAFKEYGIPNAIRTDNGNPFANGNSFYNLTRLSVMWLRLGIGIERIKPGCPQQNGRHERMHLTLKQETTRPPRENLIAQQEEFDKFKNIYNDERPHAGIKNKYPSELYRPSKKQYQKPEPLFYPLHDKTITVSQCGRICDRGFKVSLSRAFAGVEVGVKEMEDGIWVVSFLDYDLGYFDDTGRRVEPVDDPFGFEKV
ncbi:MAG: transposase [Halobacteriovoraceae bacterium]|nr:transposase [Halobacteriovoraceae bacterium]MCB9095569.1 transposase [Halobacteriovoraceae bacterium]